jgi:hypothetical protein
MTTRHSAVRRAIPPLAAGAFVVSAACLVVVLAVAVIFIRPSVSPEPDTTSATVGGLHYSINNAWVLDPRRGVQAGLVKGLPASGRGAGRRLLYGVFVGVTNETGRRLQMASDIELRDTQNREYAPVPLGRDNAFAYRAGVMAPKTHRPAPSTPAGRYLDADGLLLAFRVPREAYESGPLELVVHDPQHPASVSMIQTP